MSSLAGTFDVIAPRISPALGSAQALERARSLCAALPAALTNRVYVECRAASDAPQVDLIVSVNAQGRGVLSATHGPIALGAQLRDAPAWRNVRALAAAWDDPRNPLHDAIRRLWLEFDLDPHAAWQTSVERPGVFVDLAPSVYAGPTRDAQFAACAGALSALGRDDEPGLGALRRCIAALPDTGCLRYLGVFPGRDAGALRACVAPLSDSQVEPYLDAVGWMGSRQTLREMLAMLGAHPDARGLAVTVLHLDLGHTVEPRVGLERALRRASQPRGRIDDGALLDALERAGLCSTDKRRALELWPGAETRVMPHELWPAVVARRVNHIKVVAGGDEPPRAKIYLCATHQYCDRNAAAPHRAVV